MDASALAESLRATFATIPDPRPASGRRHPLSAILTLCTAAMLAGARSQYAIAQWGRLQTPATVRALGFTRNQTPCGATLHLLFKKLDAVAFEAALSRWATSALGRDPATIAVDGKALRGWHGETLPGVRLVAAYATEAGLVLAQAGGPAGSAAG